MALVVHWRTMLWRTAMMSGRAHRGLMIALCALNWIQNLLRWLPKKSSSIRIFSWVGFKTPVKLAIQSQRAGHWICWCCLRVRWELRARFLGKDRPPAPNPILRSDLKAVFRYLWRTEFCKLSYKGRLVLQVERELYSPCRHRGTLWMGPHRFLKQIEA